MKLQQYLSVQHKTNKIPSIFLQTDLEPADLSAIFILIAQLKLEQGPIHLTFLVGEGHSGIKVLRMQHLIDSMRKEEALNPNITTEVLQGYGSGKNFELDGLEFDLNQEALQAALTQANLGSGLSAAEQENSLAKITQYFSTYPETFVLSIKPPRELVDLANCPETVGLMRQAIYWGTFSFNIRTLISEAEMHAKDSGADVKTAVAKAQMQIFKFLESFKSMHYFESFFAMGECNSFNERNTPNLFYGMQDTVLGRVFIQLMDNWNKALLKDNPDKIAAYSQNPQSQDRIKALMAQNWTSEATEEILMLLDFNDQSSDMQQAKDEVLRKLKKWENNTNGGRNFIAADGAGVLAALRNEEELSLIALPAYISFNESYYPVLSTQAGPEGSSARVLIMMPSSAAHVVLPEQWIVYLRLIADKAKIDAIGKKMGVSPEMALQLTSIQNSLSGLPLIRQLQQTVYQQVESALIECFHAFGVTTVNDCPLRIATVGEQAGIEESIIASNAQVVAVFFVPTPLTPFYISEEHVKFDEADHLYKITASDLIPAGLIPEDKVNDPAQLSTVLRRVKTVHQLLEKGVKIFVFCANKERPMLGNKDLAVDNQHLQIMQAKYPDQLVLIELAEMPKNINAANYFFASGEVTTISAAQMGQKINPADWGVHSKGADYQAAVDAQLKMAGLPSIEKLLREETVVQSSIPGAGPG